MPRPGEDELIARYFAPLAGPGALALKDDAALLAPPPGHDLVLTADAIVAGVHFLPDDPPGAIGRKALGVNLSDLAAKGADPLGFLLTLALPADWTEAWLAGFCSGLGGMARELACPLLGGDTVRTSGPLSISVTALGAVPAGRMVRRTAAAPGQAICVTGTIGDAALGLALARAEAGLDPEPGWAQALSAAERAFLLDRYRNPQPRTALAASLRRHAKAAMDVSDGLAGDLAKMLRASGVSGTLALDRVPLSPAAQAALAATPDLLPGLVSGGDDYEILLTAAPDGLDALAREAAALGIGFAVLGEVRSGPEPLAILRNGAPYPLSAGSFQHF
ncbi:thiamine-phosphate kinase [Enterovirga aerilata]|uniref:Thiamine-monophosphate kinase n=1 Tax=Enterovirga aerilata TaxID=2730920 RepID=A0A849I7M9_9HYPH|nr:thiamine-phosphate kinase [Enterovirga sp. DB1703]NNM73301.1 thiamine-phosphate kinase [Enterovirga sp. DB1703]